MSPRQQYIKILKFAKSQKRKKLKPDDPDYVMYHKHHILPKSLFPMWKKRKSNLILLTPKEHLICHELMIKIWPSNEMTFALHNLIHFYGIDCKNIIDVENFQKQFRNSCSIRAKRAWNNGNYATRKRKIYNTGNELIDNFLNTTKDRRNSKLVFNCDVCGKTVSKGYNQLLRFPVTLCRSHLMKMKYGYTSNSNRPEISEKISKTKNAGRSPHFDGKVNAGFRQRIYVND